MKKLVLLKMSLGNINLKRNPILAEIDANLNASQSGR